MLVDDKKLWIAYTTGILSELNTTTLKFKHHRLFDVSSYHTADFSVNSMILDNNDKLLEQRDLGI